MAAREELSWAYALWKSIATPAKMIRILDRIVRAYKMMVAAAAASTAPH